MRIACTVLALALMSCATAAPTPPGIANGETTVTGWARVAGEVMLYESREAMLARDQSRCVSGIRPGTSLSELKRFDGKKVVVTGKRIKFAALPNEATPVLQRKILNDIVVSNFCYKDDVLSINRIELAR